MAKKKKEEGYLTHKVKSTKFICAMSGFIFLAITMSVGIKLDVNQYLTILTPLLLYITGKSTEEIIQVIKGVKK